MCFVYTTMVLGQPARLSKEACEYAADDWLSSFVSQRVVKRSLLSDTLQKTPIVHTLIRWILALDAVLAPSTVSGNHSHK